MEKVVAAINLDHDGLLDDEEMEGDEAEESDEEEDATTSNKDMTFELF